MKKNINFLGLKLNDSNLYGIAANNNAEWRTNLTYSLSAYANQWVHVAFVIGGLSGTQTGSLYVNGQLVDQYTGTASYYSSYPFNIGNGYSSSYEGEFKGYIDDVKVYSYARTPAQIAYDYNRGEPVGYWALDEGAGSIARDFSGNGINGTITIGASGSQTTTTAAWTNGSSGKFGYSLNFDGTDDYIDSSMTLNATAVQQAGNTYMAWVKTASASNKSVLGHSTSTSYSEYNCGGIETDATHHPYMVIYNGSAYKTAISTTAINDSAWHHVAGVHDPGTANIYIYVDGKLTGTTAIDGTISCGSMLGLQIGKRHKDVNPAYFSGQIDDVRVYNYVLTADQIKRAMNQDGGARY